jgi:HEAT repeat protein
MPDLHGLLADLSSGDETRAEAACASLVELGDAALPALRDLLDSPDADTRWWATRTLASLPNLDPGLLLPPLTDAAPEVRQCAALGLYAHPSEAAIQPLVRALSDEDALTAELASGSLVAIGASAIPALLEVLKDARPAARIHAMHALSEIGDERAIRPMIESLGEQSAMLGYWAEKGLERLGVNMVYIKP